LKPLLEKAKNFHYKSSISALKKILDESDYINNESFTPGGEPENKGKPLEEQKVIIDKQEKEGEIDIRKEISEELDKEVANKEGEEVAPVDEGKAEKDSPEKVEDKKKEPEHLTAKQRYYL
jgi:hypothetical protein